MAAVAALDRATAEEALSKIHVEYEELPAVIDVDEAMADGAPRLHDFAERNICAHPELVKGDVEKGFAEADEIFEDEFEFPMIYHYSMEPHTAIAQVDGDGITIWTSTGHPFGVRQEVAEIFHSPLSKVRVHVNFVGGAYGSKSGGKIEPLVAALARKAQRPVRVVTLRLRGDGHLPPPRDQVQGQNRRQKRRHPGGEASGYFSQHRRLRRNRPDGYRANADAHSRPVSLSQSQNQFLLRLHQHGFRRFVPFHRRAADRLGDGIADGYHRAEARHRSG